MRGNVNVILIGGSSATGKTFLAKQLSQKYNYRLIKLDDIRYFVQHVIEPEKYPDLFKLYSHGPEIFLENDVDFLVDSYLKIGKFLSPGINCLVDKFVNHNQRIIIEGVDIYPSQINTKDSENLQGIFLHDSYNNLLRRNLERGRGQFDKKYYMKESKVHERLGKIIVSQVEKQNMTALSSSPFDTLFNRAIEQLKQ